ncbi:MAG: hypothetical protein ACI8R1_001543 [Psychrobacter glaciei]|jgi:hypothetical protein|uniref:hypothetical protein n=1 Tax=Psychrobacter glaciei TaxID=619771 RepID=UPI0039E3D3D2
MNSIDCTKLKGVGLLSVIFSASVLLTACGGAAKKNTQPLTVSKPTVAKQLDKPSLSYLSDAMKVDDGRAVTAQQWLTIAQSNYQSKKYARSLRAATEALSLDDQLVRARQLAMLSAVKVTESNIDAYSDNAVMNDNDKARFKDTLTNMTTLVSTAD